MSVEMDRSQNGLFLLFKENVRTKIIRFFIEHPDEPYSPTEISRNADFDRSMWYEHEDDLLTFGLIKRAERSNFQLNEDNHLVPLIKCICLYDVQECEE